MENTSLRLAPITGITTIKKENFATSSFLIPSNKPVTIVAPDLEIPGNGNDDDGNGYTDDLIGWDFVDRTNWYVYTCIDLDCGDADKACQTTIKNH